MKKKFPNKFLYLLLAILFFAISILLQQFFGNGNLPTINDFQKTLLKKEVRLTTEMAKLAEQSVKKTYNQLFSEKPNYYNQLLEEDGLALLIYENDTLKFWSDNSIAVENWIKEVCLDTRMVKLRNGWFEVMKPLSNAHTSKAIVGLILIKNDYPYQNKYLVNEFQKDFTVSPQTKLISDNPNSGNVIKNNEGNYLFSLNFNSSVNRFSFVSFVIIFSNLLAFVFLILFFQNLFFRNHHRIGKNYSVIIFVILCFLIRAFSTFFSFPNCFYSLELFTPKVFADANSIWLSSLGDLLLNSLLFFYLSHFVLKEFEFSKLYVQLKKFNKVFLSLLIFLAFYWFSWVLTQVFIGLIKNSNIVFSINNLFSLNAYSYAGIVIIGLLLFSYFLIANKIVSVFKQTKLSNKQFVLVYFISITVHILISHLLGTLDLIVIFMPFVLVLTISIIKMKQVDYSFSSIIILVFIFSLYAVHIFNKHTRIKENETRIVYAERISVEQDPIAEFLFQKIEPVLQTDTVLINYVNSPEKNILEFEKRIKQNYFSGYWEKYDVHIALFDSMCVPVIKSQNPQFDNNFYFDKLITDKGKATSCEHFNFIKSESGKISYLTKLIFYKNPKTRKKFGTLYIELDAKFISDEIGFPELLLDRSIGLSEELTNYSYAKYKHSSLTNHFGRYSYPLSGKEFESQKGEYCFFDKDNFNHLIYRPDPETVIVLSLRNLGVLEKITTFSYLFAFFSLLLLSILLLKQLSSGKFIGHLSFKNRIQILLVFIVLVSLALFGGGTIYYIKQKFETQNQENISEKIHSVLIDLESKLSNENVLTKNLTDYVSFTLKKSSSVFFTDINLYDMSGNLYSSSRSKVFDEGLTSKKINPEAFLQIAIKGKTEFVHDERIGRLNYLSAYIPFKSKEGKLLAYLNLPYFAKQSELEKEISGFLVALINIYVLLFALSIIIAILISNYVTKPLKIIQDKLSKIKLGKSNEPIEWSENDEIGNLVSEYNRMISELSKSAELLAKSERESAWREMAKQVAHEIKNPLTPMKLSVQHLQRAYNDNAPDMQEKMARLTKTIIEQIDSLSTIANEFSNFAKLPKTIIEKIDVRENLSSSLSLFTNSQNVKFEFNFSENENYFVLADKEQLLRVFNNLIKNAIQAIPENREGKVKIELKKKNKTIVVSISDNGIGITEEEKEKIFVPNFTTKTGGMGLGLAIVKNILESVEGKINFETSLNSGTTFFVSLKAEK